MSEYVDGHRWPTTPPAQQKAKPEPQARPVPTTELPRFSVAADYRTALVAVLFDPDDIPALAAHPLFAHEADLLHAAALDVEQEIDAQVKTARDKTITGGLL